jgi:hypothetical protein
MVEKPTFPHGIWPRSGSCKRIESLGWLVHSIDVRRCVPLILTRWEAERLNLGRNAAVYVQGLHILRQPSDALAVTCDNSCVSHARIRYTRLNQNMCSTTHLVS